MPNPRLMIFRFMGYKVKITVYTNNLKGCLQSYIRYHIRNIYLFSETNDKVAYSK
jgi:hypothetical protein